MKTNLTKAELATLIQTLQDVNLNDGILVSKLYVLYSQAYAHEAANTCAWSVKAYQDEVRS